MGSSSSTSSTCRVTYEECAVPNQLATAVVVIIVEEELPTLHSTEVARLLPLVVKELRSLQK
jgi:hypothetical protein